MCFLFASIGILSFQLSSRVRQIGGSFSRRNSVSARPSGSEPIFPEPLHRGVKLRRMFWRRLTVPGIQACGVRDAGPFPGLLVPPSFGPYKLLKLYLDRPISG